MEKEDPQEQVRYDSLETGWHNGRILPLMDTRNPDRRNKYLRIILDG